MSSCTQKGVDSACVTPPPDTAQASSLDAAHESLSPSLIGCCWVTGESKSSNGEVDATKLRKRDKMYVYQYVY